MGEQTVTLGPTMPVAQGLVMGELGVCGHYT